LKKRIGVIGCGHWGKNYVRVFNEIDGSVVLGAFDSDAEKVAALGKKYPAMKTYASARDLFADGDIDAVVISTPATTHHQLVKQALAAGKPVLVEKPMTVDLEESEELQRSAAAAGSVLMVGHTFIYNNVIRRMKELMREPGFGKVYCLYADRTHLGLIRDDVNAVWDLAAHDVSIFMYLLDQSPRWVSAVGSSFLKAGREDLGFITLMFSNGVAANIRVSWLDANKVRQLVVVGSGARLVFDDLNNLEKLRIFEKGISVERPVDSFGEFQYQLRDGSIVSPNLVLSEPLKVQCQHFIDCLNGKCRPLTDGRSGADVVRVMCAIEQSIKHNGKPVEVSNA